MKLARTGTLLMLAFLVGCGGSGGDAGTSGSNQAASGGDSIEITVIPKGTAHPYWRSARQGAEHAAQELGVKINWVGPENEDDRMQQIQLVNNVIASGVDALVLAPLDDTALVAPVANAIARGIPVVIIDSGLNGDAHSSFVATDNREGGRIAARMLGNVLGGKGRALMMRYQQGSASTTEREEGFLEVMQSEFPEIELVSTNQYGGVTRQSAMDTGVALLTAYGQDLDGVFCPNESSASGMLQALRNTGYAGRVKFVGFDASKTLITGMREGHVHGLVAQDPFGMGEIGVRTAVKVLRGEEVEKRINTRIVEITPENLETPEIQELIAPEMSVN